jgi:hypothetical protein
VTAVTTPARQTAGSGRLPRRGEEVLLSAQAGAQFLGTPQRWVLLTEVLTSMTPGFVYVEFVDQLSGKARREFVRVSGLVIRGRRNRA